MINDHLVQKSQLCLLQSQHWPGIIHSTLCLRIHSTVYLMSKFILSHYVGIFRVLKSIFCTVRNENFSNLAIAPMTPPTSSFLNLSLASIRLRQTDEIYLSNSFALNFLNLLLYFTCQSGQRRRGQEQEKVQEQSLRWRLTAAPGDSALQKPL